MVRTVSALSILPALCQWKAMLAPSIMVEINRSLPRPQHSTKRTRSDVKLYTKSGKIQSSLTIVLRVSYTSRYSHTRKPLLPYVIAMKFKDMTRKKYQNFIFQSNEALICYLMYIHVILKPIQ